MRSVHLTRFISRYVPRSSLDALCFGQPVKQHEDRDGRQVYHFRPGQVFGVVWWRRYSDDRQHRAVAIVEALGRDQAGHELPSIRSVVALHAIVDQHGPAGQDGAVDLLLDLIDDLKRQGQKLEEFPPAYWTDAVLHILLHVPFGDSSRVGRAHA